MKQTAPRALPDCVEFIGRAGVRGRPLESRRSFNVARKIPLHQRGRLEFVKNSILFRNKDVLQVVPSRKILAIKVRSIYGTRQSSFKGENVIIIGGERNLRFLTAKRQNSNILKQRKSYGSSTEVRLDLFMAGQSCLLEESGKPAIASLFRSLCSERQ